MYFYAVRISQRLKLYFLSYIPHNMSKNRCLAGNTLQRVSDLLLLRHMLAGGKNEQESYFSFM